jgi:hypothetical protein
MHAHIYVVLTQANYMHTSQRHTTLPHHATCKPHMCMFTGHSGCVYVHAACVCRMHYGIIHAWSMCLCNYLHVACLCQGCKFVVYVHACGWHACMQCEACMCVWYAFMWHIGMPGGCIVLVPYLLQNWPTI